MIHETIIKLENKEVNIRFGMWTISQMINIGYKLDGIQEAIEANPIDFYVNIVRLGACNAADKNLDSYGTDVFYDWLDNLPNGFKDDELQKVQKCFTDSLSFGVKQSTSKKK